MAVAVANINYTDTFAGWIEKTNQIAYVISTSAVTSAANTVGATTTGNVFVQGTLSSNVVAAATELRGGTVSAAANLAISTNTVFGGTVSVFNSNVAVLGANLQIAATRTAISSANLVVTSNTLFSNTVLFSNTAAFNGATTFANTATFSGSTLTINSNTVFDANTTTVQSGTFIVNSNTALTGNVSFSGSQADITSNVSVNSANVTIAGGTVNVGSTIVSDLKPSASGKALGNTANRWALFGTTGDLSTSLTAANTTLVGSFANVVAQAFFRSNTNFLGTSLNVSSNADFNSATFVVRGGTANIASMATFNANTTINGSTLTIGANTTFGQKVIVNGDLNVSGNLTFNSTSYADIIPSNVGYSLGNTSLRWTLFGAAANIAGNLTVLGFTTLNGATVANGALSTTGSSLSISTATVGAPTTNSYLIFGRGSSANAYIGWNEVNDRFVISAGGAEANLVIADTGTYAISITGGAGSATSALTANNATNFNGQSAAYYANATNITSGTLANTRLSGTYPISVTGNANNATNLGGQPAAYYLSYTNLTNTPTTVAAAGLTDAVDLSTNQTIGGLKTFTSNTSFNGMNSYGSTARQMINLYGTAYGLGVQDLTTYVRTQKGFAVYQGGSHSTTEGDAGSGGTSIFAASNTALTYKTFNIWHAGNYTPVVRVANTAPNGNGDVVLTSVFQAKNSTLDSIATRSIGVTNSTDIVDRASGDLRYAALAGASFTGRIDIKSYRESKTSPSIVAGVLTLDMSATNFFEIDLNANITSIVLTNLPPTGVVGSWIIRFNILGAFTIAWPTACKHSQGTAPTISSTLNDIATFTLYTSDGGINIPTFFSGNNR